MNTLTDDLKAADAEEKRLEALVDLEAWHLAGGFVGTLVISPRQWRQLYDKARAIVYEREKVAP